MTLSAREIARKNQWRTKLLAERGDQDESTRSAEATALLGSALEQLTATGAGTVCAYVPVGSEPGSVELLDGIRERGGRVLLPIVVGAQPLDWADYTGPDSLRAAGYGLREPTGPPLGASAIGAADIVLVPALAVDRHGNRLGRGGGHYDRSLPLASAGARLVALVRDSEFVDELPDESHDVRMNAVLTPERGVVGLPL